MVLEEKKKGPVHNLKWHRHRPAKYKMDSLYLVCLYAVLVLIHYSVNLKYKYKYKFQENFIFFTTRHPSS